MEKRTKRVVKDFMIVVELELRNIRISDAMSERVMSSKEEIAMIITTK